MSGFISFGGASQPVNPNATYEPQGFSADGTYTSVTVPSGSKTTYANIGSPTSNAWCGFWLYFVSTNTRLIIDIRVDSTIVFPDLPLYYGGVAGKVWIPIAVPAGSQISIRGQAASGSQTAAFAVEGMVANSTTPPGYTQATALTTVDTSLTRPGTTAVAFSSSGPTFTSLVAALGANYGAIMASVQSVVTNPATAQRITPVVGLDAAGGTSYAEAMRSSGWAFSGSSAIQAVNWLIESQFTSGSRIAAGVLATTPGSDSSLWALHGFS